MATHKGSFKLTPFFEGVMFKAHHQIFIFKETIQNKWPTCILYKVSDGKS